MILSPNCAEYCSHGPSYNGELIKEYNDSEHMIILLKYISLKLKKCDEPVLITLFLQCWKLSF